MEKKKLRKYGDITKTGIKVGKSYHKMKRSLYERHTNKITWKIIIYFDTQQRVNINQADK